MITLFESGNHKNVMFNDLTSGEMVQANQHIIAHDGEGIVLDPGGHKVYPKLFSEVSSVIPINGLKYVFFSHQDPDIVAAANGWLMVTDAKAYLPGLWMRFIPHFGVDSLVIDRVHPIPEEGMVLRLKDDPLKLIPAHFLHSPGNFQLYDPISKILYSGDLGASIGASYAMVEDFDDHIRFMDSFHQRYMPATKALKMWVSMVKALDVEIIAPQHGAIFGTRDLVERFIAWIDTLSCGLDLMGDTFTVPE